MYVSGLSFFIRWKMHTSGYDLQKDMMPLDIESNGHDFLR